MSKRLTKEYYENVCKERNHVLTSFDGYVGVQSLLSFECLTCGHIWVTSARSYLNSKSGCWSCKKKSISRVQKGKQVSNKTRERLSEKAKARTEHWYQLNPQDWHRTDTLYLVLLNWNGKDILKVGRSFSGSAYHKGRLKLTLGEWKAPSFWVWWTERIVKQMFSEYRYLKKSPRDLKGLPGYSECFSPDLEAHRVITVIESLMSRQSAAKP